MSPALVGPESTEPLTRRRAALDCSCRVPADDPPVSRATQAGRPKYPGSVELRPLLVHLETFGHILFGRREQHRGPLGVRLLEHAEARRKRGESIIVCGDVNTAHTADDLARPKENETSSGFLPEERAWIDSLLAHGYIDTFRMFTEDSGNYSWWDYKSRARERNVGWRLDYFFVSEDLKDAVTNAFILTAVTGSDHCPVGIELGAG